MKVIHVKITNDSYEVWGISKIKICQKPWAWLFVTKTGINCDALCRQTTSASPEHPRATAGSSGFPA